MDYLRDEEKKRACEDRVLKTVHTWRDHPALLGWTLGNEVWGLLKHHFHQPYLTEVRLEYVRFLERLAKRIRDADPEHPVFAVLQHTEELPGGLHHFATLAPSLGGVGINSY